MTENSEKIEEPSIVKKTTKKEAFTIRIEPYIIEKLQGIGEELSIKPATVARNYIHLSQYFITRTNLEMLSYDGNPLSVIPTEIFQTMLELLNETQQRDFGDKLGISVNNNSQLIEKQDFFHKIEYLHQLGWLKIKEIGKNGSGSNPSQPFKYKAISTRHIPIAFVHALLYRILYNRQFLPEWSNDNLRNYLSRSIDDLRKIQKDNKKDNLLGRIADLINRYRDELGGDIENYGSNISYYYFEKLKFEVQK